MPSSISKEKLSRQNKNNFHLIPNFTLNLFSKNQNQIRSICAKGKSFNLAGAYPEIFRRGFNSSRERFRFFPHTFSIFGRYSNFFPTQISISRGGGVGPYPGYSPAISLRLNSILLCNYHPYRMISINFFSLTFSDLFLIECWKYHHNTIEMRK